MSCEHPGNCLRISRIVSKKINPFSLPVAIVMASGSKYRLPSGIPRLRVFSSMRPMMEMRSSFVLGMPFSSIARATAGHLLAATIGSTPSSRCGSRLIELIIGVLFDSLDCQFPTPLDWRCRDRSACRPPPEYFRQAKSGLQVHAVEPCPHWHRANRRRLLPVPWPNFV